jgi:molecular chaperone Hsp33
MTDQLKKFLCQDQSARVQAVKLTTAWQSGLAHQHYPECVQRLLGELCSAAVLLAANIKFDGSLVLQLQGDGPIALMVVECSADLAIRATVTVREGHTIPTDGTLQSLLNTQGKGRFIVVLDPNREATALQPYQGVIPMEGATVAHVLQDYMRNSEQLDTRLWLASNDQHSAGLLLQRLPGATHASEDDEHTHQQTWERLGHLAGTVQYDELLALDTDTLIHRLFWEEDLLAFKPETVRWHCPCSRERVANMLRMLGRDEIEDLLSERETIDISCNFCGKPYRFDSVDCASLFVSPSATVHEKHGTLQ